MTARGCLEIVTGWGIVTLRRFNLGSFEMPAQGEAVARADRAGEVPIGSFQARAASFTLSATLLRTARVEEFLTVTNAPAYAVQPRYGTAVDLLMSVLPAQVFTLRVGRREIRGRAGRVSVNVISPREAEVTARIEALDPLWYSVDARSVTVEPGSIISVQGHVPVLPVITVRGTTSGTWGAENERTGVGFSVTRTVSSTRHALLDTARLTAGLYDAGGFIENLLPNMSGGFIFGFQLLPGRNEITLTGTSEAEFEFREGWRTWAE